MKQSKQVTHDNGSIRARNLSAYWLPQITLKREIGGTVYRVFGSYEGEGLLDRRTRRILAQQMEREVRHP